MPCLKNMGFSECWGDENKRRKYAVEVNVKVWWSEIVEDSWRIDLALSALVLRTSGVSVSEDIMAVKRDTIQLQCALFLSKWYFFLLIFFPPTKYIGSYGELVLLTRDPSGKLI